jgi:hypothetical protein
MAGKTNGGDVADLEREISAHLAGLERKKRLALLLALHGAAMPAPSLYRPRHSEKERQRAIERVKTNAARLRAALSGLDQDALEYVAEAVRGIEGADRNARARSTLFWATRLMQDIKPLLNGLAALEKVPPYPYRVRRELLLAQDVVSALADAGMPATASDTGAAADCFRAVARIGGIPTSESPRYWIARAKAAEN